MRLLAAAAAVAAAVAAASATGTDGCGDLSGTWRMADVNPSAQYIASVTPGKLSRYQLARAGASGGKYVVTCQSGPCARQPNATLTAEANGTVRFASPKAVGPQQPQDERSPGKCRALLGTHWFLDRLGGEAYTVKQEGTAGPTSSHFTVTCVKGPGSQCSSWQSATGTLHVPTQTVDVKFNSGGSQSGSLAQDCKRVYWCAQPAGCTNLWCDKDECSQPAPPAPAPPPPPPMGGVVSVKDSCHAIFWRDADGTDGGTAGGPAWFREVASPPPNVTVHIVPHSHLDPGWLFTVEAMYEGTNGFSNSNDKGPNSPAASGGIGALITQMIAGVAGGKDRTFAPEIGVFYDMWWRDANTTQRDTVRRLVKEGRLEWTGGGWTQHDEACSRIEDQVDNLCLGHLWLKSVVNYDDSPWSAVKTAWQPDPFGHSSTAAYLFRMAGFDFYGFGRGETEGDPINQQTAALWHALKSFPDAGKDDVHTMLTHEQRTGYWNPYRSNHGNLLNPNPEAVADNLILLAQDLVATAHPVASNVVIMFGDDHRWEDAQAVYVGLDQALAAINKRTTTTGIHAQYSTPSKYAKALNDERIEFPARPAEWDMLPLIGDEMGAPWSGFFTSRPGFKALVRASSSMWRAAQQLHALQRDPKHWMTQFAELLPLWKAMGLAVAHDALPGDGFGIVSNDFTNRLKDGIAKASSVASAAGAELSGCAGNATMAPCVNATGELCLGVAQALSAGKPSIISAYNPQMSSRDEFVELLVPAAAAKAGLSVATADTHASLPCQLSPSHMVDGTVLLTFKASLLPLGLHHFLIEPATNAAAKDTCQHVQPTPLSGDRTVLGGEAMKLVFNSSGALQTITAGGTTIEATTRVLSYQTTEKTENSWDFSTNGKGGEAAVPFPGESSQSGTITEGLLFSEVVSTIDAAAGVTVRYRLYAGANHAHVFVSSGPFDVSHHLDQNVILRFDTNISSGSRMLTDSNGLEWIARERDQRPWQVGPWINSKEPVASNYYPATLAAILPSTDLNSAGRGPTLSVVVGSAQGAASMADGSIELMVNRAVLDPSPASGPNCDNSTDNHLVTLHNLLVLSDTGDTDGTELAGSVRPIAAAIANPVVLFNSVAADQQQQQQTLSCTATSPVAAPLPPQLELLSLQMLPPAMNISLIDDPDTQYNATTTPYPAPPVSSAVMLLRLRHLYAAGDGGQSSPLGKPVTIDMANLFAPHWTISDVVETTLSGSMTLQQREGSRLHWRQQPQQDGVHASTSEEEREGQATWPGTDSDALGAVTIAPMEVRTWKIAVAAAAGP
jgi:lysosomal alpha-mannosidase